MPYPQNLETAIEVENIVRGRKACPATIAIIDGVVNIGLSEEKLVALAQLKNVRKCSVRDLPFILASSGNGATTVASTMRLSNMVGIKVFATGGKLWKPFRYVIRTLFSIYLSLQFMVFDEPFLNPSPYIHRYRRSAQGCGGDYGYLC